MQLIPIALIIIIGVIASFSRSAKDAAKQKEALQKARSRPDRPAPQPRRQAPQPETPRAHTVITPTLHDHSGMYEGSLGADDGTEGFGYEGRDRMPGERSEAVINATLTGGDQPRPAAASPLALRWTGDSLLRAVVMQEVLRRPCEGRGRAPLPRRQG